MTYNTSEVSLFLTNLTTTCRSGKGLSSDGKARASYQWIIDFFIGRSYVDDFKDCCDKLKGVITTEPFKSLSLEDKLDILHRIQAVSAATLSSEVEVIASLKCALYKGRTKKELVHLAKKIIARNIPGTEFHKKNKRFKSYDLEVLQLTLRELKNAHESFSDLYEVYQTAISLREPKTSQNLNEYITDLLPLDTVFFNELKERVKESDLKHLQLYQGLVFNYFQRVEEKMNGHTLGTYKEQLNEYNRAVKAKNLKGCQLFKESFPEESDYKIGKPTVIHISKRKKDATVKKQLQNIFLKLHSSDHLSRGNNGRTNIQLLFVDISSIIENNKDDRELVQDVFSRIDDYLERKFFTNGAFLREKSKAEYAILERLFEFFNAHIDIAKGSLRVKLKVKLSNLPCSDRSLYPNTILTKKEQAQILARRFQIEEDKVVSEIIHEDKEFTGLDIKRLSKLLSSSCFYLSEKNKGKLQSYIAKKFPEERFLWTREEANFITLKRVYPRELGGYRLQPLKRIAKNKMFFAGQLHLKEEEVKIPYWFHATDDTGYRSIMESEKITVQHRKAYKGAWISTRPEERFGYTAYGFTDHPPLDNVFIGYQFEDRRWRGCQSDIDITKGAAIIGAVRSEKKNARKSNELDVSVISWERLQAMQEIIRQTLGTPNLPYSWW